MLSRRAGYVLVGFAFLAAVIWDLVANHQSLAGTSAAIALGHAIGSGFVWAVLAAVIVFALWQPPNRLGSVVYWVTAVIAALMLAVAGYSAVFGSGDERFTLDAIIAVIAGAIWFAGRLCRQLLLRRAKPAAPASDLSPGQKENRASYFVRHWRGDLSLPVSYWINYVLITFVAVFAISVIVSEFPSPDPTRNVVGWAAYVSLVWFIALIVGVWQLVGVWRSAEKHKSRGGSGFWAGAARVIVIFGVLALVREVTSEAGPQLLEVWRIATGDASMGKHELRILRNGSELEYEGGITFGATDEVRKMLDADLAIRAIHLNSQGGRIEEARKMRELIRERSLVTYTASYCASACTIAFMGGVRRYIAPDAKLGFHRSTLSGLSEEDLARENEADRQALIAAGVPAWFANRAYSTPSDSMWWPTIDELRRANVVTDVATPDDFALSGFGERPTAERAETELLKIPLYAAIRDADRDTYNKMLNAYVEAATLGKTESELIGTTRRYVAELAHKYLPVASDDAVIEMVRVMVLEMNQIGAKNADACFNFLFPRPGVPPVIISQYVSVELQNRDLAATTAVIESGARKPQRVPTEKEIEPKMNLVINALRRKFSSAQLAAFADPDSSTSPHPVVCGVTQAFYEEILALSSPDNARLLRFLFSQPS